MESEMKLMKSILLGFSLVILVSLVLADDAGTNIQGQQQNMQNQQNGFGNFNFDIGLPESSFADTEYVGQQRMMESMTSAYNWISSNSSSFAQGCVGDKAALVSTLTGVIKQSQEASTVCSRLDSEAKICNPDDFCSQFSSGKIPLPAEAKYALKKAGIDESSITIDTFNEDTVIKLCRAMAGASLQSEKDMLAKAKDRIKEQLPNFRVKCEELKKFRESGDQGFRLPDIYVPGPQQMGGQSGSNNAGRYIQGQNGGQYVSGSQYGPDYGKGCQGPGPPQACGMGAEPFCDGGVWKCRQSQYQQQPGQMGCQGSPNPPQCGEGQYPACEADGWHCRERADYRPPENGGGQGGQSGPQGECAQSPPQCPNSGRSTCESGHWECIPNSG
ncbi:MAG TPA: hypothetical protein HA254_02735, partial [Candidatus Diapherotrites archaeon]|nr:hypothetical protein [Candidatus Diapherotrites archaeon]